MEKTKMSKQLEKLTDKETTQNEAEKLPIITILKGK